MRNLKKFEDVEDISSKLQLMRKNANYLGIELEPETGVAADSVSFQVKDVSSSKENKVVEELMEATDGLDSCLGSQAYTMQELLEEKKLQLEHLQEIAEKIGAILRKHRIPGKNVIIRWQID